MRLAMTKENSPPGAADYGMLFLLAAIFGAAFMLITVALESLPVMTIVAARLALAGAMFIIAAAWIGQSIRFPLAAWGLIVASAVLGNAAPFYLITWGQEQVDAGLAAILISIMPLMTMVLAHFLTDDERLNWNKVGGICMGLTGVIILFGFDKLLSLGDEALRQYAILGAAACYAVNVIIMKKLTHWPRYALISAILIVSFLAVFPFALVYEQPWTVAPTMRSLIALFLLGILSSGFGSFLRFAIVERQGAGFISQINYLIPLMAVFWAWLFLAETPEPRAFVALGLIFAGLGIVRMGTRRPLPTTGQGTGSAALDANTLVTNTMPTEKLEEDGKRV